MYVGSSNCLVLIPQTIGEFDSLQIEQGPASIWYLHTCSTAFSEYNSFLLHEASTYIFQDMIKDLKVPFCDK